MEDSFYLMPQCPSAMSTKHVTLLLRARGLCGQVPQGPLFGLMCHGHHLEILISFFYTRNPFFAVSPKCMQPDLPPLKPSPCPLGEGKMDQPLPPPSLFPSSPGRQVQLKQREFFSPTCSPTAPYLLIQRYFPTPSPQVMLTLKWKPPCFHEYGWGRVQRLFLQIWGLGYLCLMSFLLSGRVFWTRPGLYFATV